MDKNVHLGHKQMGLCFNAPSLLSELTTRLLDKFALINSVSAAITLAILMLTVSMLSDLSHHLGYTAVGRGHQGKET